jgi:hypothetical protein
MVPGGQARGGEHGDLAQPRARMVRAATWHGRSPSRELVPMPAPAFSPDRLGAVGAGTGLLPGPGAICLAREDNPAVMRQLL